MNRFFQAMLIGSTLLASWLGMQAVHEAGHVLAAVAGGGKVEQVVLHPLTISRTDLAANPAPLPVAWAGPLVGVLLPLAAWGLVAGFRMPGGFVLRFFAGFCLIANGVYIGIGSFTAVGDSGDLLRHGSPYWPMWLFGAVTIPAGIRLWHRQGPNFGLGSAEGRVDRAAAWGTLAAAMLLLLFGFAVGGV